MKELSKAYEAKKYEEAIYKRSEGSGFFNPDNLEGETYAVMMPPPNVTGVLHLGHALENALMDTMVRYQRMKGKKVLLLPGTDHAAVATQAKVESLLVQEGVKNPREELGRDELLKRIREYAENSKATILNQIKKMGTSADWSRLAYTFDEQRSRAVNEMFTRMYNDGLIYQGFRVVNWSVKGQSTCSDDELEYIERPAKLYYFKYSKDFPITIATTRPETKLGDTAVAVNPNDERYKKYIGHVFTVDVGAEHPLTIKIIAHEAVDPSFGTGALGVTPAHSAIDFEIYEKQKALGDSIGFLQVIGMSGKMNYAAGKNYVDLSVEEAREKFVSYLKQQNLLEKEEEITQRVTIHERFKDVIEVVPMTQWFIDVNKKIPEKNKSLKDLMREAVTSGHNSDPNQKVTITPERFEKIYLHWIDNLRDWCISRQIWWGHPIPVWYCKNLKIKDQKLKCSDPIISKLALKKCPYCNGEVKQDPDTLDTWFSSGLWTFSTLGWPITTVQFVRHGEAENSKAHIANDETNGKIYSLNSNGKKQIIELVKSLKEKKVDLIFSSPITRAKETAEILSSELGGVEIVFDGRLREVGMGKLNEHLERESDVARIDSDKRKEYDLESHAELRKRTDEFLKEVLQKYSGKHVVVVSHGDTLSALKHFGTGQEGIEGHIQYRGTTDERYFDSGFNQKNDLRIFHPTCWMQMGHEILFFWMARMILMSTYALNQVPFKDVYIHGILRDENGNKFSKSAGNGIDPLVVIEKYGADALRWSVLNGITPGNDSRFYEEKIEGARNLVNKLWNIARFIIQKEQRTMNKEQLPAVQTLADAWILDRLERVRREVTENLDKFQFSYAGEKLRDFTWNELADWYLECVKFENEKSEMLNYVLNTLLKLWHPFLPFVTEAIWQEIYGENSFLMTEKWPEINTLFDNDYDKGNFENNWSTDAEKGFASLQNIITTIRSARADYKIEPAKKINVSIKESKKSPLCKNHREYLVHLARIGELVISEEVEKPQTAVAFAVEGVEVFIDLAGVVDLEKEKQRISKEFEEAQKYVGTLEKKLANQEFVKNAPQQVVTLEKEKLKAQQEKVQKLQSQLISLQS